LSAAGRVTKPAWRRADVALLAELPGLVRHYGLATRPTDIAITWLAQHQAALGRMPRQLVHGDIGPDNVLLDGEQVVAIIDFTPHVLPVLFAASTALYWYRVYGQPAISADENSQVNASQKRSGRKRGPTQVKARQPQLDNPPQASAPARSASAGPSSC
jgi:hypothetical protein